MHLADRITVLAALGQKLEEDIQTADHPVLQNACRENPWFTPENSLTAISAITKAFLDPSLLQEWLQAYEINEESPKNKLGLILAGNIPLVGFHDILCGFLAGYQSQIKLSSKDQVLNQYMLKSLIEIDPQVEDYFCLSERISGVQKLVATGGESAGMHFRYYFRDIDHIIRDNRSSVAVLSGEESEADLTELGRDIFLYFGLGCRNITKLYLPEGFDPDRLFKAIYPYYEVINHHKYKNNYDYNFAIYSLGQEKFLTNDFLILKKDPAIFSRIAALHYENYPDMDWVQKELEKNRNKIQCVAANHCIPGWDTLKFGTCQNPGLSDYADGIDTMKFLTE